ncbi:MAG: hypothetical protein LZF63_09700 [Nitrosomonas sp.]|nr:hypothetical protein [Nitrosomonas sp.]
MKPFLRMMIRAKFLEILETRVRRKLKSFRRVKVFHQYDSFPRLIPPNDRDGGIWMIGWYWF